ncbi:MAG: DNA polymerase III subunit beta [Ruminococcaceae bacterium]|nr:DNA polymerase III subunit beta [Oscillospiraceae bacterium]
MKFTVLKSVLMDKLVPAMGTVSNKNTITSIEGVLLETIDDQTVRLSTYDMNKGVRATFTPSEIEREGRFIINAQRFYQTVKVMPEQEITIDINDNLNCTISSGKASFSMYAMNGDEFPVLPELTAEQGFEISGAVLKKLIGKVFHSIAAEQDIRPMLRGAFFKLEENRLEVVSCDSFTLSKCEMTCDIDYFGRSEHKHSLIIPSHALAEMMKIIDDSDEKVRISLTRKHAIVRTGDMIFFTRTIDSEYIDYNKIIPKNNDIFVTVNRERLLSGLERANIIAEEKIQGSGKSYVKIRTEESSLTLTSSSVNGKVYDEMECIHEGGDIEIGFNCRYLINSVKVAEGEKIFVTFKNPTQAITIEAAEKNEEFNYFYMILPVRMKNDN